MSVLLNLSEIESCSKLSSEQFFKNFVDKNRPVVIKGGIAHWPACSEWGRDYFRQLGASLPIRAKVGGIEEGQTRPFTIGEYLDVLEKHEAKVNAGQSVGRPPYWHDYPIFHLIPQLTKDASPFPVDYLPKWYQQDWHKFVQFFMGGSDSLTPLHFDTLYSNNLFFQVKGRKRFYLIAPEYSDACYVYKWRWAEVDPHNPDFERHPLFKDVKVHEVVVEGGDILYIPAGYLHQVHGLSFSISFNIDWHTPQSAMKGIAGTFKGAPLKNLYYNMLVLGGQSLGIPSKRILPFYKSYLNYIS